MASFLEQLSTLAGELPTHFTSGNNGNAKQILEDGTKDVIRRAITSNPEDVWLFTASTAITSTGLSVESSKIYDVSRGNKPCSNIPVNLRHRASENDSIYYATSEFPVYYLLNSKVFVLPHPGAGTNKTITAFTTYDSGNKTKVTATAHGYHEQDQIVIEQTDVVNNPQYYSGTYNVFEKVDDNNFVIHRDFKSGESATGYRVSEPAALCQHLSYPTVTPTLSAIENFPPQYYSAVVHYGATVVIMRKMSELHTSLPELTMPVGPVAPTLKVVTDSIPTYNGPQSLVLPVIPSDVDVDLSGINAPSYSTISNVVLPNLSFDINSISIADLDLGVELPAPPESPSFDNAEINMTIPRQNVPSYTKPTFTAPTFPTIENIVLPAPPANIDLGVFSDGQTNQAGSNTADYVMPVLSHPDFVSVDTSVAEEDIEVAGLKLQKIQAQITVFQSELTNAAAEFNQQSEIYKKRCDEALSNSQNSLNKDQNEKQLKLAKHSQEVQVYQADVTAAINKWDKENLQVKYTKWVTDYANKMQEYQQDIANEVNEFNKEVQIYQAELAVSTGNATNKQGSDTQEYQAKMSKYSAEIQAYQAKTTHVISAWQQKIVQVALNEFQQKRQDTFQEWSTKMQTEIAKYNAEVQAENTEFQAKLSLYQQNITKQLSTYQAETGYDMSIYQNSVNAATSGMQAELSRADADFKNRMDNYVKISGEVRAENSENSADYGAKMQYWTTESSNATSAFTTKVQSYGQEYTWLTQKLQSLRAVYESMFILSTEAQKQQTQGVA